MPLGRQCDVVVIILLILDDWAVEHLEGTVVKVFAFRMSRGSFGSGRRGIYDTPLIARQT